MTCYDAAPGPTPCTACGGAETMPYWAPSRRVKLLAAIVTTADKGRSWMPSSDVVCEFAGKRRTVYGDGGGHDVVSLRSLETGGFVEPPDYIPKTGHGWLVPTKAGRDELARMLATFERIAKKRGPAPRRLGR